MSHLYRCYLETCLPSRFSDVVLHGKALTRLLVDEASQVGGRGVCFFSV